MIKHNIILVECNPLYQILFEIKNNFLFAIKNFILKDLKLQYGKPATPELILNAEDLLLDQLNLQGYAFAKILERKVFADLKSQEVKVKIEVDIGPLTYFVNCLLKVYNEYKKALSTKKLHGKRAIFTILKKLKKLKKRWTYQVFFVR